jgi:hypothetical protein
MGDRVAEPPVGPPDSQNSVNIDPLESAYRRIREVRRSLLELSASMSSQPSSDHDSFHPGHEAIYLTGHRSSTIDQTREASPSVEAAHHTRPTVDVFPPFPSYGVVHRRGLPPVTDRRSAVPRHRPALSPTGNSQIGPEIEMALARLRTASQIVRRTAMEGPPSAQDGDDPRTALGRRVAAREAAPSQRPRIHDDEIVPLEQTSSDLYGGIEDLQNRLHGLLARVMERSSTTSAPENGPPGPTRPPPVETAPPRSWFPADAARSVEPIRTDHSGRLSVLSNIPARNFSTPSSVFSAERALLFDEPTSYLDETDVLYPQSSDRSYVVRRTLVNGREVIHTLPSLQADAMSWMMPPQLQRTQALHRSMERARRTGPPHLLPDRIPRLDLDGNEITTIVEEQLDDPPYEFIVRIRRSNSGQTVTGSGPSPPTRQTSSREWPPRRGTNVVPQAWPAPAPSLDYDPDVVHRTPFHPDVSAYTLASSLVDSVVAHHATLRQEPEPLHSPFITFDPSDVYVDPLPMPLSEMTSPIHHKEGGPKAQPISLSIRDQAQLACR